MAKTELADLALVFLDNLIERERVSVADPKLNIPVVFTLADGPLSSGCNSKVHFPVPP